MPSMPFSPHIMSHVDDQTKKKLQGMYICNTGTQVLL